MEVTSQGNIANLIREVHQVGHEIAAEENRRQVCLFDSELLLYDGRDDGL